ncbi:leucine-rich repeat extensin-like protein 3 [Iris pallida]|uniref:Leucine-rich repeat extensin-like protein 3 n=1 Tax=Iris pallida TaxID=29817 RepID=A0AAX6HCF0_IRIPA|nr:leucine-rich repeat extensin-like protein 3 [Iris pallida]
MEKGVRFSYRKLALVARAGGERRPGATWLPRTRRRWSGLGVQGAGGEGGGRVLEERWTFSRFSGVWRGSAFGGARQSLERPSARRGSHRRKAEGRVARRRLAVGFSKTATVEVSGLGFCGFEGRRVGEFTGWCGRRLQDVRSGRVQASTAGPKWRGDGRAGALEGTPSTTWRTAAATRAGRVGARTGGGNGSGGIGLASAAGLALGGGGQIGAQGSAVPKRGHDTGNRPIETRYGRSSAVQHCRSARPRLG